MAKAQIVWDQAKQKYHLVANKKTLVSSKKLGYLTYLVAQQKHSAIIKAKVTEYEVVTMEPQGGITISTDDDVICTVSPDFNIDERFEFLQDLIMMVIDGKSNSLVISGNPGLGKTHNVLKALNAAGKINCNTIIPNIEDLNVKVDDDEEKIKEKAYAQINAPKGDYIIVKGHASAKALYRLLYENRERTIIFDDCDDILRDKSAIDLLKSALDSYEDRWVSWYIEKDTDLPTTFKFKGKIVFVTNIPIPKIDSAVRSRAFKVDIHMTKPQCIQWIRKALPDVLPDVDLQHKEDALNLLEENMHITNDVNFRSLMNLTTIRTSPVRNWKKLGVYSLMVKD